MKPSPSSERFFGVSPMTVETCQDGPCRRSFHRRSWENLKRFFPWFFLWVFPMTYIYILYRKNHRKTHGIAIFPTVFAFFFPVKTNPMVSLSFYPTVYKDLIQFCPIWSSFKVEQGPRTWVDGRTTRLELSVWMNSGECDSMRFSQKIDWIII